MERFSYEGGCGVRILRQLKKLWYELRINIFSLVISCCKEEKYEEIRAIFDISRTTQPIPFKFDTQGNKTIGHLRDDVD